MTNLVPRAFLRRGREKPWERGCLMTCASGLVQLMWTGFNSGLDALFGLNFKVLYSALRGFPTGTRVFLYANQRFILTWFCLTCSLTKRWSTEAWPKNSYTNIKWLLLPKALGTTSRNNNHEKLSFSHSRWGTLTPYFIGISLILGFKATNIGKGKQIKLVKRCSRTTGLNLKFALYIQETDFAKTV